MARKGLLPPPLKINLKTRYPLPLEQQPQPVLLPSDIPPYPQSLPCAEPESLGNDQIRSDYLEVLAADQGEERWEIPLAARPDDMVGKHRERREILLVQVLGGESKVVPKRESTVESSFNVLVRSLKHPGSCVSRAERWGELFFLRAAIKMKLKKVPSQINAFQESVTLATSQS